MEIEKPRRKPYYRGYAQAIVALKQTAEQMHALEKSGTSIPPASTSIAILGEVVRLENMVTGEASTCSTRMRLAQCAQDLGQHVLAGQTLEELAALQRRLHGDSNAELAETLRLLAGSYFRQHRVAEALETQQSAETILIALLGQGEIVEVFRRLVRDQVAFECAGDEPEKLFLHGSPPGADLQASDQDCLQLEPKRGEIWWVRLPQYPLDRHQPRPAVIVSENGRNRKADKVHVVPLTSTSKGHFLDVAIPHELCGLAKDGFAKCGELSCISKLMLRQGPVGQPLPDELVDKIVELSRRVLTT
jgi:mRNA-degrading endonuclease toxin of MazEF toxin-antitoxin module